MSHQLETEDFDSILFEQFGVNKDQLLERLDQKSQVYENTMKRWRQFLETAKTNLMCTDCKPIEVLKQLDMICRYQELIDDSDRLSLCEQFKQWKTNRESIASLIDHLQIVKEIPKEGLDNFQLEGVLQVMQNTFQGIQLFKVQTRDFMFCDVQKRFHEENYPSEQQMEIIQQVIDKVDENGNFKKFQSGLLKGSAFGRLTGPILSSLYIQGIDLLGIIINTSSCDQGGTHWVAIVIDHKMHSIELFDSTGEYRQELKPAIQFCKFLVTECSNIFGTDYIFKLIDEPVQQDLNTCGVFSLFYIYARILGSDTQRIKNVLMSNKGNDYIRMFKSLIFA